jgi:protein SMG6
MDWLGRRVYERGFWKPQPGLACEGDVLDARERSAFDADSDGVIEDADGGGGATEAWIERGRWVRIARSALALAATTGVEYRRESGEWSVGPALAEKVRRWREEEQREREEEERRRARTWEQLEEVEALGEGEGEEDGMEVDDGEYFDGLDEQTRALLDQRRRLQEMQMHGRFSSTSASVSARKRSSAHHHHQRSKPTRRPLFVLPGYTILVVDTNVFLRALPSVTALVESERWTVVIPLAVITELDGLAAEHANAAAASKYISEHMRAPGLKVQTSRGNYLSTLTIRSEKLAWGGGGMHAERTMDDLILNAALWQDGHWLDRSAFLRGVGQRSSPPPEGAYAKVVLVSFDRNRKSSRHLIVSCRLASLLMRLTCQCASKPAPGNWKRRTRTNSGRFWLLLHNMRRGSAHNEGCCSDKSLRPLCWTRLVAWP